MNATIQPSPVPPDIDDLLNDWECRKAVPRVLCACGRAYVLDPAPGEPCDDCKEEIFEAQPRCGECGDRGWVWHPDAVCFASELDAQISCPACGPVGMYR